MKRVREVTSTHIEVDPVGAGRPLQVRPGYDDGEVMIVIDRAGVAGVAANVSIADLRVALDFLEVQE